MSELILKKDALNCFHDWIDRYGHEHTADEDAVYQRIAQLPAVQPERKQGKWKSIGWSGRIHKCNQCGNMLDFGGVNAGRGDANFCPNCGADMRGEAE